MLASRTHAPKPKAEPPVGKAANSGKAKPEASPNPAWAKLALRVQPKLEVGAVDDPLEREADRVADRVMRMADRPGDLPGFSAAPAGLAQRQCAACAAGGAPCPKCEEEQQTLRREAAGAGDKAAGPVPGGFLSGLGPGRPLDEDTRAFMEPRFGLGFDQVRVHTDGQAGASARAVSAKAFTVGRDVVFGAGQYAPATGEGRRLLAHELAHVAQQGSVGVRVQRYESGEHAQLGDTKDAIKGLIEAGFNSYTVLEEDFLETIASSQSVTVAALKDQNSAKLRRITVIQHPGPDKGAYMVVPTKSPDKDPKGERIWLTNQTKVQVLAREAEWDTIQVLSRKHKGTVGKIRHIFLTEVDGFAIGETIHIPSFATAATQEAFKGTPVTLKVNGVALDYGVGIAMGDLFETPEQMANASAEELKALSDLIKREKAGGSVSTEEWQKATGGRYLKLAEKNVSHFAPPNKDLVTPSAAGAAAANHKTEWEKHHKAALEAAQAGDKDKALMINAFGDHFLTDAFSAGHLINKPDVMEAFKSQLKLDAKGEEFTKESQKFFDEVAKDAFTGSVKTEFSKYETVKTYYGVHPDIDSPSRFSQLLQAIHKEEPDLLANAVAKGVHDKLNTLPGGLPVENAKSDAWQLSGDGTLNAKTKEIALKAVAQSQLNVLSRHGVTGPLNLADLNKKVWDYTPVPSKAGAEQVVDAVKKGTEIDSADLKKAVVKLIQDNYLLIIDELVKRKKLQKA